MAKKICITLLLLTSISSLFAQQLTQSIRGKVLDEMSNIPLPYVTVVVLNTDPIIGATTDPEGNFTLRKVPVGRHDIQFSFVGYESKIVKEILVVSSKETQLNTSLQENTTALDEVVVRPAVDKGEPLNNMATISARMLSVEEAQRYAGGFDDPARLASAFAGVASNVGNNGIVVRGNAPRSLQWKMEGVEIPNPNHFAELSTFGGGGLTALSSQMLANSDFLTGAFPAEYNNALSGVFDIFMRNGNSQDHNHTFQAGIIGIDLSSEGPFKKGKNASYLFNYRYSTLSLVEPLLPDDAGGTKYQDLSFKFNFPTKNLGVFQLWGIGLVDESGQTVSADTVEWEYLQDREEGNPMQYMGATGLNHEYFFGNSASLKTTLAATVSGLDWEMKRMNQTPELLPQSNIQNNNWNFVFKSALNKKFSAKHTNKTGVTITGLKYDMLLEEAINTPGNLETITDESGFSTLLSAYTSSAFNLSSKAMLVLGVNGQLFTLNNNFTIEPRAAFKYFLSDKQSVGFAYGLHSRLEKLNYYFTQTPATGTELVNKNLDFTKSHHFVLSYDIKLSENLKLKAEPYFQYLFDVPVIPDSSFSFINLNSEWFFNEKLENTGKGKNYGIDLTLEKYLSKGYYFMSTLSVFKSEYLGGDDIWRNTAFDRNFVMNLLGGKEWQMGKQKQNTFGLNLRMTFQGGDPYTPVDEEASLIAQDVIYDETKAFSLQNDPSFVFHFTTTYRINKKKTSQEIALKVLNATVENDFYGFRYNYQTHTVDKHLEGIIIPNLSYKIEF